MISGRISVWMQPSLKSSSISISGAGPHLRGEWENAIRNLHIVYALDPREVLIYVLCCH